MRRSLRIPPILALPRDTTASDALLGDILEVLKDNKAYQVAVLEQQSHINDSLVNLNRSLVINREERHAEAEVISSQVDGLRQDLSRLFVGPTYGPEHRFRETTGMGRRTIRRSRRSQTPGPTRRSPLPADSESLSEGSSETEDDPDFYRYSGATAPVRGGYTPAPTHPVIPSVTTGMAVGSPRLVPPSPSNLRSESRQRSSQGSSGLTYVSDGPVIPPLPPGFVPYPDQTPEHRQNPFPTPRAPPQQSPLHPAPVPPPPQMYRHKGRASDESQSD